MNRGFVQVYTGNGKGKTTAAIGLAVRAAGAGLRIFFCQFLKSGLFSEIAGLKKLRKNITVRQFGNDKFVTSIPSKADFSKARIGFFSAKSAIESGKYDVVILDEINHAISLNIIDLEFLIKVISNKPKFVEIILTGRDAPKEIIEIADLVTEMIEVKHYYSRGIRARKGIEK